VVRKRVTIPISADSKRNRVARAALEAGAEIVNDVSGLRYDPEMAEVVARHAKGAILMASEAEPGARDPIEMVVALLREGLRRLRGMGVPEDRAVVDPGIGFFRQAAIPWHAWDCEVLRRLAELRRLGCPIVVGLSRKSFIGQILGQKDPSERLVGSLAATAVAVVNGAHVIRTHDIGPTREAVRMAEALRSATGKAGTQAIRHSGTRGIGKAGDWAIGETGHRENR
jgi:dihydropteroate synthase